MPEKPKAGAWPDIVNFRDVGGLAADGGRVVRRGLLYRGTALHNVTDDDLQALANLGVGLVFDLRSSHEANGRPDRLPPGAAYRRVPGVMSMEQVHHELLDWDNLMEQMSASDAALAETEEFQAGVYPEMIKHPDAFEALVGEMLSRPDRPTYVHCSAGKDRTGVACAIVLRLLGVSRADALADYLESANHPAPEVTGVLARAGRRAPKVEALIKAMLAVSEAQFDAAFAEADRTWGSWDGFVKDGLGLTPDDVQRLRDAYLEDAAG